MGNLRTVNQVRREEAHIESRLIHPACEAASMGGIADVPAERGEKVHAVRHCISHPAQIGSSLNVIAAISSMYSSRSRCPTCTTPRNPRRLEDSNSAICCL